MSKTTPNTKQPYEYASAFPIKLDDLISRFGINDVNFEIENIARSLFDAAPSKRPQRKHQKNVIIKTANHPWEILSAGSLAKLYSPEDTSLFFYMPKGYQYESVPDFPFSVAITPSITELLENLKQINPDKIYVQLSPHAKSEFLIIPLVFFFPEAEIVAEFYDMGFLFSDEIQKNTRNYTDTDIIHSHIASWVALTYCNAVLVKAGGQAWDEFAAKCPAPCFSVYPMLDTSNNLTLETSNPNESLSKSEDIKIIFAGSVTSSELLHGPEISPGANFLEYFKEISNCPHTSLSIFNAAQVSKQTNDPKFSLLKDWLQQLGDNIHYSHAIPQKELLEIQNKHDLGFFCVHYANDKVEHVGRIAIPNRVMSYLCSDLPIIVDSRAEFMAELVQRFEAGLIIDPAIPNDLTTKLAAIDIDILRMGAKKLKDYLFKINQQNLQKIEKIISTH